MYLHATALVAGFSFTLGEDDDSVDDDKPPPTTTTTTIRIPR